ncbi:MAG: NAD-binding protein [Polyangiaceae bacterium]|nr:NAD-binding protein [Polyangiaceae bacterium]
MSDASIPSPASASPAGAGVVVWPAGPVARRVEALLARAGIGVTVVDDAGPEAAVVDASVRARAVALVADDEAASLRIAARVRELAPAVRVVLVVSSLDLARHLDAAFRPARGVVPAAIAAAPFAYAVMGCEVLAHFELRERAMLVGRVELGVGSSLVGATAARLAARGVAVVRGTAVEPLQVGARPTLVLPRAELRVLAGDRLLAPPARPLDRTGGPVATMLLLWRTAPGFARAAALALAALTLGGGAVVAASLGWPQRESGLAIVALLTGTAGVPWEQLGSPWAAAAAAALMAVGAVGLIVLPAFVTAFVVRERLEAALRSPKRPARDHVLVVGIGALGYRVARELAALGHYVIGVDRDARGPLAAPLGAEVPIVEGDARARASLDAAAVERAAAVVVTPSDDAVTAGVALTAARLAPHARVVARAPRASLRLPAGAITTLDADAMTAAILAGAALDDGVLAAWQDGDALCSLREQDVPDVWLGRTPDELHDRGAGQVLFFDGELAPPDAPLRAGRAILLVRR